MEKIYIYSISDSVGETSESVIKAALCQFNYTNYEIKKYSFVSTLEELKIILEESKTHKSIFFYTLVETELVNYIKEFSRNYEIKNVDLLSEALNSIAGVLNMEPKREPGILRRLNMSYFDRIEAVEFAVKYDDGKDPRGFMLADIILLGISRTSKTPLSLYLANKNYKVANFPVVPNVPIPKELIKASPEKIFGLNPKRNREFQQHRRIRDKLIFFEFGNGGLTNPHLFTQCTQRKPGGFSRPFQPFSKHRDSFDGLQINC